VTGRQHVARMLAAGRAGTVERITGLERDRAAIIGSSGSAGTDDEHDPEGATIAFERRHLAALISHARGHLAQIDAGIARLEAGSFGRCESCGQPLGAARLAGGRRGPGGLAGLYVQCSCGS
jgi:DnaK suppressor protein